MIPVAELTQLLSPDLLDRLALAMGVNKVNQVRLPGQAVFLCLLNGLVNHPELTQQLLADFYASHTGQPVHRSSFAKALKKLPVAYFEALFQHLFRQVRPQMQPGDLQSLRLRIIDATVVSLSAKLLRFGLRGGNSVARDSRREVKAVFELGPEGLPQLLHVCREQKERCDNAALGDPMLAATVPGDLWLFDRGCFDRHRLLALHQKGAFFLTPHKNQSLRSLRVLWEADEVVPQPDPPDHPAVAPKANEPHCRLLRVEQAIFENTVDAHRSTARARWSAMPLLVLHAERWDQRQRQWVPHVLLTNLPQSAQGQRGGPYTFPELLDLYRRRWEIEVFFKFLKQHLGYRHLVSRQENGLLIMIWMTLITAVLLFWYRQRRQITTGWRSVKYHFAENTRAWLTEALREALLPLPAT